MKIIDEIILNAIKEDMPNGDVTTDNLIPENSVSSANLVVKEDGIISGLEVFKRTFELINDNVSIELKVKDGDKVTNKEIIAVLNGNTRTILKGERVALNLLQRMSGIATNTNRFVEECVEPCKILDTRKTTPNLRFIEKKAVRDGGGMNHRYSLSDMVMIKDNHIDACGSIKNAVFLAKEKTSHIKIEVETENLDQFKEALDSECDIIMLDNMSNELMSECVKLNKGMKLLEASGNMTVDRINSVSKLHVDFISVGALTHSSKALDISLKFH